MEHDALLGGNQPLGAAQPRRAAHRVEEPSIMLCDHDIAKFADVCRFAAILVNEVAF
jgi:hypothetical protein